jgi:hypothetical protein
MIPGDALQINILYARKQNNVWVREAMADGRRKRWPMAVGRWPKEAMREETLFEGFYLLIE